MNDFSDRRSSSSYRSRSAGQRFRDLFNPDATAGPMAWMDTYTTNSRHQRGEVVQMFGGYFYAKAAARDLRDGASTPVKATGPIHSFRDAQESAGLLSKGLSGGERYSPGKDPSVLSERNVRQPDRMEMFRSIAEEAMVKGGDPLDAFRQAYLRGHVDGNDPRQMAAAYSDPDVVMRPRLPDRVPKDPIAAARQQLGREDRDLLIRISAAQKALADPRGKGKAAHSMEQIGMELDQAGKGDLAMSFLVKSSNLTREVVGERAAAGLYDGRSSRPRRREAREEI